MENELGIPSKDLLDAIYVAESRKIHRNFSNEKDITGPGGQYFIRFRTSKMYLYILEKGKEVGLTNPTSEWTQEDIDLVNTRLDNDIVDEYVLDFYLNVYFKGSILLRIPKASRLAFAIIYLNSRLLANKAIQQAMLSMQKSNIYNFKGISLSKVDGKIGSKTKDTVDILTLEHDKGLKHHFETMFLSKSKSQYIILWSKNKEDFSRYLLGWNNRVERYEDM